MTNPRRLPSVRISNRKAKPWVAWLRQTRRTAHKFSAGDGHSSSLAQNSWPQFMVGRGTLHVTTRIIPDPLLFLEKEQSGWRVPRQWVRLRSIVAGDALLVSFLRWVRLSKRASCVCLQHSQFALELFSLFFNCPHVRRFSHLENVGAVLCHALMIVQ